MLNFQFEYKLEKFEEKLNIIEKVERLEKVQYKLENSLPTQLFCCSKKGCNVNTSFDHKLLPIL